MESGNGAYSTTFIPQSLHRGGLVMTTGGHPPPEIKRRSLSCSAGHVMAEVEMSKHGIRALVISAVIGLFIWIALFSVLREIFL